MSNDMTPQEEQEGRTFSEELEVAGNELVTRVQEIVKEGNVRRVIIRKSDGTVLIEVPLTVGALAGGVVVLWAPVLAALGALAALVAKLKIEIVREVTEEGDEKQKVDIQNGSGDDDVY